MYDPRIHSTPPTTNKDGTWRAKRGVKAEEIATVRAEREAAQPVKLAEETVEGHIAEVMASAPPAPPAPTVDARTLGHTPTVEVNNGPTAPVAPPAPIAVEHSDGSVTLPDSPTPPVMWTGESVPENERAVASYSFLDVMKAITAAQKDGKIDTAKVKELCAAVGAGESTMGLNGPDNGDKRVAFMALLASETEGA